MANFNSYVSLPEGRIQASVMGLYSLYNEKSIYGCFLSHGNLVLYPPNHPVMDAHDLVLKLLKQTWFCWGSPILINHSKPKHLA
jgi:hypothetical protein